MFIAYPDESELMVVKWFHERELYLLKVLYEIQFSIAFACNQGLSQNS